MSVTCQEDMSLFLLPFPCPMMFIFVLVSAGIKLILSPVAGKVLCFGFMRYENVDNADILVLAK